MIKSVLKRMIPDRIYLKMVFKLNMGYELDLKNPQTFNEKLQWLKLHDRNPYYTKLVDKYEVKKIVADKIGEEYVIPTYGVWKNIDDINFDKLPDKFVLKCTHDCGSVIVIEEKKLLDINDIKKKLEPVLEQNYYYAGREWPYKNVKPRIIAEAYLENRQGQSSENELIDYKVFCFHGKAVCVMLCTGRKTGNLNFYYFDRDWNFLRFDKRSLELDENFSIPKPEAMDKMFELAEVLSKGMKHVRVDFYEVNNHIYFGELTFFTAGGFDKDITREADLYLGSLIEI